MASLHHQQTNAKSKKRSRATNAKDDDNDENACCFCQRSPAAVTVQLSVAGKKMRVPRHYCLGCYYTTSVVRQDPTKYVAIHDQLELDKQLPAIQLLFSEVYLELQQELSTESALAFSKSKQDPLSMLNAGLYNGRKKRGSLAQKKPPPPKKNKHAGDNNSNNNAMEEGGFMRNIPLPERLVRTQQQQAQLQVSQIARMNRAAASPSASYFAASGAAAAAPNLYQRRKSSTKSIWNLAMDPNYAVKAIEQVNKEEHQQANYHLPTCSCGSKDITSHGNVTSRNQDMSKGETWGSKDRSDDVIARYQCNSCGKMWNEEE
jgi:transposase-like protein